MPTRRRIIKIVLWILSLFVLQTVTYLFLGPLQLPGKLLSEDLRITHHHDTLYAADHEDVSCTVGESAKINLNLASHEDDLKSKLGVSKIIFHLKTDSLHNFRFPVNYPLVYTTETRQPDWISLFNFYKVSQVESLTIDQLYLYEKTTNYQWVLFFWVERVVYSHSYDISLRRQRTPKN